MQKLGTLRPPPAAEIQAARRPLTVKNKLQPAPAGLSRATSSASSRRRRPSAGAARTCGRPATSTASSGPSSAAAWAASRTLRGARSGRGGRACRCTGVQGGMGAVFTVTLAVLGCLNELVEGPCMYETEPVSCATTVNLNRPPTGCASPRATCGRATAATPRPTR